MPSTLTTKQKRAARSIAQGMDADHITYQLKLRYSTLKRWKQLPEFMEEVERNADSIKEDLQYKLLNRVVNVMDALYKQIPIFGLGQSADTKHMSALMDTLERLNSLSFLFPNAPKLSNKRLIEYKIEYKHPQTVGIMSDNLPLNTEKSMV